MIWFEQVYVDIRLWYFLLGYYCQYIGAKYQDVLLKHAAQWNDFTREDEQVAICTYEKEARS